MEKEEKFEQIVRLYKETHRNPLMCKKALIETNWNFDKAKTLLENDPRYSWFQEALSYGALV